MIFRENNEKNLAHTVFTQYINEQENQMEAELAFDASFFKANRKVNRALFVLSFISHLNFPSHPRVVLSRVSRRACAIRTFHSNLVCCLRASHIASFEVAARKRYALCDVDLSCHFLLLMHSFYLYNWYKSFMFLYVLRYFIVLVAYS